MPPKLIACRKNAASTAERGDSPRNGMVEPLVEKRCSIAGPPVNGCGAVRDRALKV
jgi:hypothetical protein